VNSIRLADARHVTELREWLRDTYPLYLCDLSEFDTVTYRLNPEGRWEPDHLPYWLEHPFCLPFVALADEVPVGFAFVGRRPFPFMSPLCEFRLCEFFVLRRYRRAGMGRSIALAVLSRMPGAWELVVLPRNTSAATFWRAVVPLVAAAGFTETCDEAGVRFAFSTRAV
jgi:predicted acetyltransferase